MIIGIVSVKNHRYHPNRRLLEASRALNHQGILVHPKRFFMGVNDKGLRMDHLSGVFQADVILPRLGATIKDYGLGMIRHFELLGKPVVNRFQSILMARNKFLTLQTLSRNGIPVPETRYASNWDNFEGALSTLGGLPVVIKGLHGRQGTGVSLIDSIERHKPLLNPLLNTGQGLLIQRFIPPEKRRDIRIMVVGHRAVGAMTLKPKKGDFRANVHLNAGTERIRPTKEMTDLAIRSTKALGLDISGVDMIQEGSDPLRVIEVNYSPGFKGMEKCTGRDVASEIIRYATGLGRQAGCK
jgi:ribosomal protein S6--L-glutamate ligase